MARFRRIHQVITASGQRSNIALVGEDADVAEQPGRQKGAFQVTYQLAVASGPPTSKVTTI